MLYDPALRKSRPGRAMRFWIAIARVMLKDASIVLLDEVTSALRQGIYSQLHEKKLEEKMPN